MPSDGGGWMPSFYSYLAGQQQREGRAQKKIKETTRHLCRVHSEDVSELSTPFLPLNYAIQRYLHI